MKLLLIAFVVILGIFEINSQAIPYSYAHGRDVNAVNTRYAKYQAAKVNGAGEQELMGICGKVDKSTPTCTTKVGRPKDSESLSCDSFCCLAGYKVGNCGSSYGVKLDWAKVIAGVGSFGAAGAIAGINPSVAANCYCSDDPIDVRCGRDGSFAGIRCPFDNSACWRKCCRQGKENGKCGGFLKTKCKCY